MDDAVFRDLCTIIADGGPLRPELRVREIGKSTFYDWVNAEPERKKLLQDARDDGEDAIAERLRQTARGKGDAEGGDSTGDVQRDKLIVDTDLKLLAKFNPKRWGDKVELAGDKDSPLTIVVRKLTDA